MRSGRATPEISREADGEVPTAPYSDPTSRAILARVERFRCDQPYSYSATAAQPAVTLYVT